MINEQIFVMLGRLVSCLVSTLITFQYFDLKCQRLYLPKSVYLISQMACCGLNYSICFLEQPVANLILWVVAYLFISSFLYYDESRSRAGYYCTNLAFLFAVSLCESLGGVLVKAGAQIVKAGQDSPELSFIYTVGGSTVVVLCYNLILKKLFANEKVRKISVRQYLVYVVISAYALVNIGEVLYLAAYNLKRRDGMFLIIGSGCIVFINLYLFSMLDAMEENRELKYKVALYEQQAKCNYDYYARQMENRKKSLQFLHDTEKHMRVLRELREINHLSELERYTKEFTEMISPIIQENYCNNAILNIILLDKVDCCSKSGIRLELDIHDVDIEFMDPMDVTTIFGNLLDNAIEACSDTEKKQIIFQASPFNGFIYIYLRNTCKGKVCLDRSGKPVSNRGKGHGIGLGNVENTLKKYYGNIQFTSEEGMFTVEVMLNRVD